MKMPSKGEKRAHAPESKEIPVDEPRPGILEVPTSDEQAPVPMTPEDVDRIVDEIERDRRRPEPPMVN